jgi:phospholipid/cholesterol/gamma-HCH transport system ATP-binding protein
MIRIEELTYRLPDGRAILDNLSLEVPTGATMAVMGLSGTGKTTLLKCVAGLLAPASGRIWIDDKQIVGMSEKRLNRVRQQMGYVFQYAALFDSLSVYENVAFGPMRRGAKRGPELDALVAERLRIVGMEGVENLMPSELSGGMAKRVGLARALALNPRFVLYDEPTSGLDPITARVIDDLIIRVRDSLHVTSLVVTHAVNSVFRFADIATMLYEGSAVATGTPEELRNCGDERVRQFIEGNSNGPIRVV